jgi:formylmethanofuran dehydrogenase subunit E
LINKRLIYILPHRFTIHINTINQHMMLRNPKGKIKPYCSKCNNLLGANRQGKYRYCLNCHNSYTRENRIKHSELTPEQRMKAIARSYVKVYIRRGKIEKLPCEKCGSIFSECHHEDYSKPLEVKFLCRPCHLKLHQQMLPAGYFLPDGEG